MNRIYFPEFDDPATYNGVASGLDGESAHRQLVTTHIGDLRLCYDHKRRYKDVPTASFGTVFGQIGTDTTDTTSFTEMSYDKDLSGDHDGKLFARAYRDTYDFSGDYLADYGYPTLVSNQDEASARSWGAEARYSQSISDQLSAIVGAEYVRAYSLHHYAYDPDPYYYVYLDWTSAFTLRSMYAQTEWEASDSLKIVTGARLDDYSTFGSTWSPRAAAIYNLSEGSVMKLLYGGAFRAPNNAELSWNPNLRPEKIKTTELVWERELDERTRLVTSIFNFDMAGLITQVDAGEDTPRYLNLRSVQSRGIETQLERRLQNGASAYAGLSVLRARNGDGQPMINSPKLLATAGACFPVWANKLYLSSDIQYLGNVKTLAGNTIGGSAIVNLTASTSSLLKKAEVSLSVLNMFNRPTFAPARSEHVQDRIPQTERTLQLLVSYRL